MKFLTEDQKKFYQENGFILLSNVFSEEEFEVISDEYSKVFKVTNNQYYPVLLLHFMDI
jgi:hypothetical protein